MIARVEQPDGSYTKEERGNPECGRDFCDVCGDCLSCYGDDPCGPADEDDDAPVARHRWVIYWCPNSDVTEGDDIQGGCE